MDTKTTTETWRIYTYDVWGNEEDGWDINDIFKTSDTVEVAAAADTATIVAALFEANLIDHPDNFEVDDSQEDILYFELASNGKPVAELRRES